MKDKALQDPTPEDLTDPMFEAIWQAIKGWDISREPSAYRLYAMASGTDVMTILNAVRPFLNQQAIEREVKDNENNKKPF